MKLNFDNYPLNVYEKPASKLLLKSIDQESPKSQNERSSIGQIILGSYVNRFAGAGLLSLIDSISIGIKGEKARKCLSDLIQTQTTRVKQSPKTLLQEAQINLMASACVTGYLANLESQSFGNGAKVMGKVLFGILNLRNPLEVIAESVIEKSNEYDDICQVYFVAFLLNVYNSVPQTENLVKQLIVESLLKTSGDSLHGKNRPILFSDVQYKSLEENLKNRLSILSPGSIIKWDLYDPFVEWREELNRSY